MTAAVATTRRPLGSLARVPFYYGWVMLGLAAIAMVGTLPGRTQGLGLVTEPLLRDLQVDRVTFAQMNLWATLLGSLFCLGIGRLVDQFGNRVMLTVISSLLAGVVIAMSHTSALMIMFIWLVLSRGLGQSALSVVSLTMVGQWFARRLNLAMGVYSIALSMGFMAAFPIVGGAVISHGWREAWSGVGWYLVLPLAVLALLLARRGPEECGLPLDGPQATADAIPAANFSWIQALRTPAFWAFAIASSLYNLIASGIGLFNESILAERGFAAGVYHQSIVITALTSLAGNFIGGWLAEKWNVNRLMAMAMTLLAGALLGLPFLKSLGQVYAFAVVMGLAGGFVIVIFFSFWAKTFGRAQLGRIQGTAQMMTVLASAVGPLLLAKCHAWTGSYAAVFYALAGVVALSGLATWVVRMPQRS